MDSDNHKCSYCGKNFRKKRYHYAHLREVHKVNARGKPVSAKVAQRVFECVLCYRKFPRKNTMERHVLTVHPDESRELFKCEQCEFRSIRKDNIKRHYEKCHLSCADGTVQRSFQCSNCSANFKLKASLSRHENKHHNRKKLAKLTKTKKTLVYKRKCPLCPFDNPDFKLQSMYSHFENVHKICLQWENHYFESLDEFYDWKSQLEKFERSSFVRRSKSKSTSLFNCRRCGIFQPSGKSRRRCKITGTCKINGFCPSFIKIKVKNGLVTVLYQSTHVGHDRELEYVRLSNEDKQYLATKLAENVPHDEILKDIRESLTDSDLQRIHLIGRKDLTNMKRRLKPNKEEIRHPDDPASMESWADPDLVVYEEKGPSGPPIDQYCRVCGLEMPTENLIPIFGEEGCELLLEKKILDHIHLQVQQDDQLPQQVCLSCASHLNTCQQFMEASHAAAYKLHQLFLPNEIITEDTLNEANTVVEIWEDLPQDISNNGEFKENDNKEVTETTIIEDNTQTFACQLCDKIFTRRKFLDAHINREHNCWVKCDCGKVLRSKKSLDYHRRAQHSGERPYQCSFCGKGFLQRKILEVHEAKHTRERPYKCDTCGESFESRKTLYKHAQTHGDVKLFECEFCEKIFQRKGALSIHRRIHSGENLHVCGTCGRGFTRSSYLAKHLKTHEDGSSHTYICNLCLFMFRSKKELTKHEQEVHGEKNDIPLIVTNNVFETHVITEDGQQLIFPAVSVAFEESHEEAFEEIVISDVPDTIVTPN